MGAIDLRAALLSYCMSLTAVDIQTIHALLRLYSGIRNRPEYELHNDRVLYDYYWPA